MKTCDLSLEERTKMADAVLHDVIKTQEMKMKLAEAREKKGNDTDSSWLMAYELRNLAEQIKCILDGSYDITV